MFGTPDTPPPPKQIPVPQPDDPALITLQREATMKQQQSQGFEASILNPAAQNTRASAQTKTATLGYGGAS